MNMHTIYRCRKCSALTRESSYYFDNSSKAIAAISELINGTADTKSDRPSMAELHYCGDGCYGVADFIGYEECK